MTATGRKRGRCHYCKRGPLDLTKDHVIPRARGGTNHYANLVPCCGPCNMEKSADLPTDDHLSVCARCRDAVEHHWRFIISQPHYGKRDVMVALVDPLLSNRILPIRAVYYSPVPGWDPYRDDYPGDDLIETVAFRNPRTGYAWNATTGQAMSPEPERKASTPFG